MSKIHVTTADGGSQLHVLETELVLGRDSSVSLPLNDLKISRRHCRIYPHKLLWVLEDLGSSNGTRVNGLPTRRKRLRNGDRIELGSTVVVFEAPEPEEAPIRAPVRGKRAAPTRRAAPPRAAPTRGAPKRGAPATDDERTRRRRRR
jgi:predicted component of type VI protein secretion system